MYKLKLIFKKENLNVLKIYFLELLFLVPLKKFSLLLQMKLYYLTTIYASNDNHRHTKQRNQSILYIKMHSIVLRSEISLNG